MDVLSFETTVMDIIQRSPNVKSFRFEKPKEFVHNPGQFMVIKIKQNGEIKQKHFTISASPTDNYLEFTKKITDHEFSIALDHLAIGDWAEIRGPYGEFTIVDEKQDIVMLTGGIGITPMRSNIRYATDKHLSQKIMLFYSNKTEKDIVFRRELEAMQQQNPQLRILYTLTQPDPTWKGSTGHFSEEMIKSEIKDFKKWAFYTAGPPGLVDAISKLLVQCGVDETNIHKEQFPGY